MAITLDGSNLTIAALVRIARFEEPVELAPAALERIVVCRAMLEEKLAAKEIMYGTNTGIGEFSEKILSDDQVKDFQRYLVYNHAAGIGEPAPIEYVRAALAGRINVHAHGNSGCRPEITLTLVEMLNKGVTPVVCQKGQCRRVRRSRARWRRRRCCCWARAKPSIGANGCRVPRRCAGPALPVPGLAGPRRPGGDQRVEPADGHVGAAPLRHGALAAGRPRLRRRCPSRRCSETSSPTTPRCTNCAASPGPSHRPRTSCGSLEGSDLATGKMKTKVQDAYSMRSTPQVIGAARDAVAYRADPGRDRIERRRRQPDLHPREEADPDGRQLPGHARRPADGHGGCGDHDGLRAVRAAAEPPDEPGLVPGTAGLPGPRARVLLRADAQPVHRRPSHRRTADPVGARRRSSPSRPRRTRKTSCRWA